MQLGRLAKIRLKPAHAPEAVSYLAFAVIFAAMLGRGADGAAPAALFSTAMCLAFVLRIWTTPPEDLAARLKPYLWSAAAAGALVLVCLFSAIIVPANGFTHLLEPLWHPLWAQLSPEGRAISLAPYRTLEGVVALLAPIAAFALGALEPRNTAARSRSWRVLVAFIGLFLALAVFERSAAQNSVGRLSLYFLSPNSAATAFGVMALISAGSLARAFRHGPRKPIPETAPKWLRMLSRATCAPFTMSITLLALACVALTGSRAGLAATAAALFAFLVLIALRNRRFKALNLGGRWAILAASGLFIGGTLLFWGSNYALARFGRAQADIADRAALMQTHFQAFMDRPILGHGLNTFRDINMHYATAETWSALHVAGAAHNIFIQMLEETGLIGALLWALMLATPLQRCVHAALRGQRAYEPAAAALGAIALCFLHGMVDFGLQTPAIAALVAYCLSASVAASASGASNDHQVSRSSPV